LDGGGETKLNNIEAKFKLLVVLPPYCLDEVIVGTWFSSNVTHTHNQRKQAGFLLNPGAGAVSGDGEMLVIKVLLKLFFNISKDLEYYSWY
jgi:hypothetical protein